MTGRLVVAVTLTLLAAGAPPGVAPQEEPLAIEGAGASASAEPAPVEPPGSAEPAEPTELFVSASRAYDEGEYAAAAELFRRLIDEGHDNGHLYYNLGNAHLRNGELGRAIAAYRQARALLPRDREVRANLEFARKSTKDALAPPDPSAALTTLFLWHYELSRRELAILTLTLNLAFWAVLTLQLRYRRWEPLRWLLYVLLVPLLAVGGSLAVHLTLPSEVAVVVPQEVDAHTGPDRETVVRFKLHAGTEVRVRGRGDGWVRIALPDGQQGWIEAAHVVTAPG